MLSQIFKGKPKEHWITMWTLPGKQTHWFQDPEKLMEAAEEISTDIYYGLGSTTTKGNNYNRIKTPDVHGIGGIHVDIDFGDVGHQKSNLPPDLNTAIQISQLITQPTFIVNSGHGIHAYYLFKYYQIENLSFIGKIQKTFQQAMNHISDYQIDMTHDLARVLRIPGSTNYKDPNNPIESYMMVDNAHIRYDPEDLSNMADKLCCYNKQKIIFDTKPLDTKQANGHEVDGRALLYNQDMTDDQKYRTLNDRLELGPKRKLDSDKFLTMAEIYSPDFIALYNHTKPLKNDNGSCSGYDLALANYGATFGLIEQEIADLMIMHRQANGSTQMKFNHPYYYGMTIFKALLASETKAVVNEQKKICNQPDPDETKAPPPPPVIPTIPSTTPPTTPIPSTPIPTTPIPSTTPPTSSDQKLEGAKRLARQTIRTLLGINIYELIKYPTDPEPQFFLKLTKKSREVKLGAFKIGVYNQLNLISTIQAEIVGNMPGIILEMQGKDDWKALFAALCSIIREEAVSDDMFAVGKIKSWVRGFFESTKVYDSITEFIDDGDFTYCIKEGQYIYMNEDSFMGWIKGHRSNDMNLTETKIAIMQVGGSAEVLTQTSGPPIPMWRLSSNILA